MGAGAAATVDALALQADSRAAVTSVSTDRVRFTIITLE
ncbi:hypothetical protein M878_44650 [Streptomyces roseochromogenus subsp. oscitans DS 12.976]|uniref:Uncharacterized protein n=1 Tax=Streptomyces roseochromogenus subsp. oscitans DS 12.976 TaxID=1352936 RepID=V6JPB2_STRRC|nr:hypothetical protein M878_44650 [Streptomyces roseochromogenus subsp. oscitans DS 12.976]